MQFATGRAFSLGVVFFAMLDVTAGLALVGTILASSALLRLAILARRHAAPAV